MSCNDDKTYEPCSCGCGGNSDCTCDCNECAPVNCIEQAIRDALATLQEQLEALVKRAEDAAKASEDAAAASAASAAEAKGYRDAAELAATTATDALKTITDVAVSLEETAKKLQEIADELATAIAGIAVVTWYYTAVSEVQTVIPVPDDKNALDVQCIYIEGARQEPGRGFVFDKTAKTITLAEGIPLGLEISIILGTYSDNPTDFPHTLASTNGASLVGTTSGQTVQQEIDTLKQASGNFSGALDPILSRLAGESGLPMVGTFEAGATVTTASQSVGFKAEGKLYTWAGTLPKTVAAGSTPATAGGIAADAWVRVDQTTLRSQLAAKTGAKLVNHQGHLVSDLLPIFTSNYNINNSNTPATNATNLVAMIADVLAKGRVDIHVDVDATIDDVTVPVRDKTKVFFHNAGGTLTGLYRRETMKPGLPDNTRISNGLRKAGMEAFYKARSPNIVIMGDSISTEGPNALAKADSMYSMIMREIQGQNPTLTINGINRAIGGQTWLNANTKPTGFPAWYTDQSKDWLEYVKADAPDLLILAFGMNDANGFNAGAVHAVVDKIKAWDKVPSIMFVTNPVPAISTRWSNGTGFYATIFQEGRDWAAGYVRSYAKFYGYSVLDINRQFCLIRDGRDYFDIPLEFKKTVNQSYIHDTNIIARDFSLQGEISAWPAGKVLSVKVGSGDLDIVYITNSSGVFKVDAFCSGSQQSYVSVTTSVPITVGQTLEITVQDNAITIFSGITQVIGFNIIRTGGEMALVAEWQDAAGQGPFTSVSAYAGNWLQCKYTATDMDIWGTDDGTAATQLPGGGNGINHYSSHGLGLIVAPVVRAFDFRIQQNNTLYPITTLGSGVTASTPVFASKQGNLVTLSGNLKVTGTNPVVLFTLPKACWPSRDKIITCSCVGTGSWELAIVTISSAGVVSLSFGNATTLLPLDTITFSI